MFEVQDFLKNTTAFYSLNKDVRSDVKVFFTYKGMPVDPQFIEEYPELYPSKDDIQKKYEEVKSMTVNNKLSFFTVTENGVEDIQLNLPGSSLY